MRIEIIPVKQGLNAVMKSFDGISWAKEIEDILPSFTVLGFKKDVSIVEIGALIPGDSICCTDNGQARKATAEDAKIFGVEEGSWTTAKYRLAKLAIKENIEILKVFTQPPNGMYPETVDRIECYRPKYWEAVTKGRSDSDGSES